MATEVWSHSWFTAICLTRMELAWQSSVTTVKEEQWWEDMKAREVTHVTFITRERVCLSWRVSPGSPHTVNSLSSMSVIIRVCGLTTVHTDGGYHVILPKWRTGAEPLRMGSAHAEWPTHVKTPVMAVTVTRMIKYGVKTAVSSQTSHVFQWNSLGLKIQEIAANKVTAHWENWNAMVSYKLLYHMLNRMRISSRERAKYETVIHWSVPVWPVYNRTERIRAKTFHWLFVLFTLFARAIYWWTDNAGCTAQDLKARSFQNSCWLMSVGRCTFQRKFRSRTSELRLNVTGQSCQVVIIIIIITITIIIFIIIMSSYHGLLS